MVCIPALRHVHSTCVDYLAWSNQIISFQQGQDKHEWYDLKKICYTFILWLKIFRHWSHADANYLSHISPLHSSVCSFVYDTNGTKQKESKYGDAVIHSKEDIEAGSACFEIFVYKNVARPDINLYRGCAGRVGTYLFAHGVFRFLLCTVSVFCSGYHQVKPTSICLFLCLQWINRYAKHTFDSFFLSSSIAMGENSILIPLTPFQKGGKPVLTKVYPSKMNKFPVKQMDMIKAKDILKVLW